MLRMDQPFFVKSFGDRYLEMAFRQFRFPAEG